MTVLGRALGWFVEPAPARPARRFEPAADPAGTVGQLPAAPGVTMSDLDGPAADLQGPAAELHGPAGEVPPAARIVSSAAVLGRAGEVEPVAAALALALRRNTRAKAAAVAIVGAPAREAPGGGGGGGAPARRLVARLAAHGLEACVRGRLAWVPLDAADPQLVAAARRVSLVAAPAVLAVTAPRTAAMDAALAEQDLLVIVTADPDGPLARLAAGDLRAVPVVTVPPLTRGPARSLARAGIRSSRPIRTLLLTAQGTRA